MTAAKTEQDLDVIDAIIKKSFLERLNLSPEKTEQLTPKLLTIWSMIARIEKEKADAKSSATTS